MIEANFGWDFPPGVTGMEEQINPPLPKEDRPEYEEGQCQSCEEPLNNAEGYECTECQIDRMHQTQD